MAVTSKTQRKAGMAAAKTAAKAAKGGAKGAKGTAKMTAYVTSGAAMHKARGVATQMAPVGQRAGTVAAQSVRGARVWVAPRIDEAADAVTDTVAPKVAAALKATARRVEPRPRRAWVVRTLTDWRAVLGAAGIAAAAGTGAALVRRRGDSLARPVSGGQQPDGSSAATSSAPANLGSE